MNKQTKQSLVWGGLLILIGLMTFGETVSYLGPWIWVAGLAVGGAGVFGLYSTDRSQKWMLAVSYSLETVAALVALLTLKVLPAPFIPTFVLLSIAIPFLVIYLQGDRKNWGLMIPVYIFGCGWRNGPDDYKGVFGWHLDRCLRPVCFGNSFFCGLFPKYEELLGPDPGNHYRDRWFFLSDR